MPLVGACEECEESRPTHRPRERVALSRGPHGRRLCGKHAREAWREWEADERKRREPEGNDFV